VEAAPFHTTYHSGEFTAMPAATLTSVDTDTPEVLAWQAERSAVAATYLNSLPTYQHFLSALLAGGTKRLHTLRPAGGKWFQRQDGAGGDYDRIVVRDSIKGVERCLLDCNLIAARESAPVTLDWYAPSPNGKVVAASTSIAGKELGVVTLIDVESGYPLPDVVPWKVNQVNAVQGDWAWHNDSGGFYCSARNFNDGRYIGSLSIYSYRLGAEIPTVPEALPAGLASPCAKTTTHSEYVLCQSQSSQTRVDYIRKPDGTWVPFLTDIPGMHNGEMDGATFVGIVTDGHPRGRVVRIPVDSPNDRSKWTEIVPESDDVLLNLRLVGGHIVIGALRNAASVIVVCDPNGANRTEVPLPGPGTTGLLSVAGTSYVVPTFAADDRQITFIFSSPSTSGVVMHYDVATAELTRITEPEHFIEGLKVESVWAISEDGVRTMGTLAYIPSIKHQGPRPTLISGYGNFGACMTPAFNSTMLPFIQAGGAYVVAHLRGGGEFGWQWRTEGYKAHKQNTFNDLYAIAGELISRGTTSPHHLAFEGASGGGLTAAAAVVQRPDLWAAVVSRSPVTDLLGVEKHPFMLNIVKEEYGDPRIPQEAAWLRRVSPAENVVAGKKYCASLFIAGENDTRTPPVHARKMVFLLERAGGTENPALLRVFKNRGHGAIGYHAECEEGAEWLSFVAERTGLKTASAAADRG
jgi:prolyl oligopeptidase